jgi:hypothetical protein
VRTVTRATSSACRSASNWNWSSGTRWWRAQLQPRTLPQSVLSSRACAGTPGR